MCLVQTDSVLLLTCPCTVISDFTSGTPSSRVTEELPMFFDLTHIWDIRVPFLSSSWLSRLLPQFAPQWTSDLLASVVRFMILRCLKVCYFNHHCDWALTYLPRLSSLGIEIPPKYGSELTDAHLQQLHANHHRHQQVSLNQCHGGGDALEIICVRKMFINATPLHNLNGVSTPVDCPACGSRDLSRTSYVPGTRTQ